MPRFFRKIQNCAGLPLRAGLDLKDMAQRQPGPAAIVLNVFQPENPKLASSETADELNSPEEGCARRVRCHGF